MIKVQNWVTEDEIVTVLNAEPPRATLYARFVEAYWKGSALDEPPETAEQLSATLREWAERETRIGRAAFVANYLALAPTFTPRAATPQESWQAARHHPTKTEPIDRRGIGV